MHRRGRNTINQTLPFVIFCFCIFVEIEFPVLKLKFRNASCRNQSSDVLKSIDKRYNCFSNLSGAAAYAVPILNSQSTFGVKVLNIP